MPSMSKRPMARQLNSLSLRRPGVISSLMTATPDVSREQDRYRRLMQLNSARSLEKGRSDSENRLSADEPSHVRRPASQNWPRKLEPLPGRFAANDRETRLSPSEQMEQVLALEVPSVAGANYLRRQPRSPRRLHSDGESPDESAPKHLSNTCPDLPTLVDEEDEGFPSLKTDKLPKPPWSPRGVASAMASALTPLSLPRENEPDSPSTPSPDPSSINMIASATAVGTAIANPFPDLRKKKRKSSKKLTPIRDTID